MSSTPLTRKNTQKRSIQWQARESVLTEESWNAFSLKEAMPIPMEISQDKDKVNIRRDLKPDTLTNDAPPVEFRIWTK